MKFIKRSITKLILQNRRPNKVVILPGARQTGKSVLIKNIITENVNGLSTRNDVGELWKNYIISERIKYLHNAQMQAYNYFWRTYQQQEIDWIEEREGKLFAYEMESE
jgi:predicted AAA+ superfamily ATPase